MKIETTKGSDLQEIPFQDMSVGHYDNKTNIK